MKRFLFILLIIAIGAQLTGAPKKPNIVIIFIDDMWTGGQNTQRWKVPPTPLPIVKDNEVIATVDNIGEQADLCKMFTYAAVDYINTKKRQALFHLSATRICTPSSIGSTGVFEKCRDYRTA